MRRGTTWRVLVLGLAGAAAVGGCGRYQPALLADRPVVTVVHDDRPIKVPSRHSFDEREQVSDVYLRRPLFNVVRPLEFPTGGDVNALDEVPTSSWYDPGQGAGAPEAASGAPSLPLFALDELPVTHEDAIVVRDARGGRYELLADPPDTPGLLTGAEIYGSALLRALGLRAPRAWIVGVPDSAIITDVPKALPLLDRWVTRRAATVKGVRRASATLWPHGIDVGITGDYAMRGDDPNDAVDHHDRRTLRAMKVFAQWMAWTSFSVRSARDVYVGKPGEGHLEHFLIGASRAFGTQDLQRDAVRDEESGSFGWNLITFGLSPPVVIPPRRSAAPSLGYLLPTLDPGSFEVSPPYSPFVRLTPPDAYWAATRLLAIGDEAIRAAIDAADLPEDAGRHLAEILKSRRRILVANAMEGVSPLDVAAVTGRSVWLRDRAIAAGVAAAKRTRYEIAFLDAQGNDRAASRNVQARGELTVVTLPAGLNGLVVVQLRTVRGEARAPRACDVHLIADGATARVVGVRH